MELLNNKGIFVNKYNITNKQFINNITIESNPDYYLVQTNKTTGQGVIAWKEINSVYAKMYDFKGYKDFAKVSISNTSDIPIKLQVPGKNLFMITTRHDNFNYTKSVYDGSLNVLLSYWTYQIINGILILTNNSQVNNQGSSASTRRLLLQSALEKPCAQKTRQNVKEGPEGNIPDISNFEKVLKVLDGAPPRIDDLEDFLSKEAEKQIP